MNRRPLNPWKDKCIFIHAAEETYEALCHVLLEIKKSLPDVDLPDIGVLLNPFGHAMIFIVDLRDTDPRIEKAILNNVPTSTVPSAIPVVPVEDERPSPSWLN